MQDIEPPEVPIDLQLEDLTQENSINSKSDVKKGFFSRLFSKKEDLSSHTKDIPVELNLDLPELGPLPSTGFDKQPGLSVGGLHDTSDIASAGVIDAQDSLPELPSLGEQLSSLESTNLSQQNTQAQKGKGKSKGKREKDKGYDIRSFDETSSFDWTRPITSQQGTISDNVKVVSTKSKGKRKKGEKNSHGKFDETSSFDWTRSISEQEILIHDNSMQNTDISRLISEANNHIKAKSGLSNHGSFNSEHTELIPNLPQIDIDTSIESAASQTTIDTSTDKSLSTHIDPFGMPRLDSSIEKSASRMVLSHNLLRRKFAKLLLSKKQSLKDYKELFKQYDENIEKRIEEKELTLGKKSADLKKAQAAINSRDTALRKTEHMIQSLDTKLKERESNINNIIKQAVEKDLDKRLKIEKKIFKKEIATTQRLNKKLSLQLSNVETERQTIDAQHKDFMQSEQTKLSEMQTAYEQKLGQLDVERKEFEERRANAMVLLNRAQEVSSELVKIKKIKDYVETSKKKVKNEIKEDRELKHAIETAEVALKKEKEHLDNLVFSKYIESKIKSIKPELDTGLQGLKIDLESNPLYERIRHCRNLISGKHIEDAKTEYNEIKREFEYSRLVRPEKEALYNAIRELYNDIKIAEIESQMH